MNVESFLHFWSSHNTQIITVLIGLILVTVVYLAFRSFFGQDAGAASLTSHGASLDTAELEKTLQKILDNQSAAPKVAAASAATPSAEGEAGLPGATPATPTAAVDEAELARLKDQIVLRDRQIEELKKQTTSTVLGGNFEEEKKKFEDKIKDLEARLAEYEIISEDIADLSFYKEENAKMQKELEALKAAVGSAPAPSAVAAEPPPAPELSALAPEVPAAATPPPEPTVASLTEAAPVAPPVGPTAEESQLMNQFENFVKKG